MAHIAGPNHTQIPNVILDSMADMGNAELRVVLAVCRKTFGWQKRQDYLSLTQIQILTGLSRQGTIDGIETAIENEWIVREPYGQSFLYAVNLVDQSTSQTSRPEVVKPVDQLDEKLVKPVDTQKKEVLKEKKEITAPKPRGNPALYELAKSIAELCRMDFESNKGRLFAEAKLLSKATPAPTPELLKANYNGDPRAFWKAKDWRGKAGQPPTPQSIRETWAQATVTSGPTSKPQFTEAEKAAIKADLRRIREETK